jgi:hypothetical protein
MKRSQNLTNEVDVGYLTIDSIQEGVGYSQVVPILTKLCEFGLRIQLVSFEKSEPSDEFLSAIREKGIGSLWTLDLLGLWVGYTASSDYVAMLLVLSYCMREVIFQPQPQCFQGKRLFCGIQGVCGLTKELSPPPIKYGRF